MANIDDDQSEPEFVKFKVVILGDGAVGKTSITLRFVEDQFGKQYKQTIGVDFFSKRVSLANNLEVCLQVWDIGGQSIGAKTVHNYIYGSDALIFVYDVTNYQSFQNLDDWFELVKSLPEEAEGDGYGVRPAAIKVLMGNKVDLEHLRTVKKDRHDAVVEAHISNAMTALQPAEDDDQGGKDNLYMSAGAKMNNNTKAKDAPNVSVMGSAMSFFVSAKTGQGINNAFTAIAAELAGVKLTKEDTQNNENPISAHLLDYQRHDPAYLEASAHDLKPTARSCSIQ